VLRRHRYAVLVGVAVGFATGGGVAAAGVGDAGEPDREHGTGVIRVHGHGAEYWHWELVKASRRIAALERRLAGRPGEAVGYAIRIAGSAYGVPTRELRAVAHCETGGTMSAHAYNGSSGAAGVMQFLASTWRGTPFASFSRFDPVANVLAAAQIVARDGWAQWTCGSAAGDG
jgi:soluble lytic murein transglycosylase-like protein